MPWFQFIWDEGEGGNVEHVTEHDLTRVDVEYVVQNPKCLLKSGSSGRPALKGYTADGRYVFMVYEQVDPVTVYAVSAYEADS